MASVSSIRKLTEARIAAWRAEWPRLEKIFEEASENPEIETFNALVDDRPCCLDDFPMLALEPDTSLVELEQDWRAYLNLCTLSIEWAQKVKTQAEARFKSIRYLKITFTRMIEDFRAKDERRRSELEEAISQVFEDIEDERPTLHTFDELFPEASDPDHLPQEYDFDSAIDTLDEDLSSLDDWNDN